MIQESETLLKLAKDKEFQLMNKLLSSGTAKDKLDSTVFFIDVGTDLITESQRNMFEVLGDHHRTCQRSQQEECSHGC